MSDCAIAAIGQHTSLTALFVGSLPCTARIAWCASMQLTADLMFMPDMTLAT
jgi:hypothetical protein